MKGCRFGLGKGEEEVEGTREFLRKGISLFIPEKVKEIRKKFQKTYFDFVGI